MPPDNDSVPVNYIHHVRILDNELSMTSLTLLLALLSELATDACASDALKTRASYFWGMLNPFWGQAKELWELRYESLLSTGPLPRRVPVPVFVQYLNTTAVDASMTYRAVAVEFAFYFR